MSDPTVRASGLVPASAEAGRLSGGRLGVLDIVFFVISAAAPLTVVVSAAPLAFRLGGLGAPAGMGFAGLILILFAVGFTAMSQYVRNAGAFYAYAAVGLGRPVGVGVALVTLVAYVMLAFSFYGLIGFFGALTLETLLSASIPWYVLALTVAVIVAFLGRRQVEVGARTLGVLLTLEIGLLLVLSLAILIKGGPEPASVEPVLPTTLFGSAGITALLVLGFGAFVGFEGTAIYAEEAKDPERTVPRATYLSIGFLALLYTFTFWVLTYAFGVKGIIGLATGDSFEDMTFIAANNFLGGWASTVMQILIVTSFFACVLAFHNAASRYMFALGRERLLPRRVAETGPSGAPVTASLVISVLCVAAVTLAAATGVDPYLQFGIWTYSAGVAGVVFAQATTSAAVLGFFRRDRRGHSIWRVLIAPLLGSIGLISGFVIIVLNFEVISGLSGAGNWLLMAPTPILLIVGVLIGLRIKHRDPQRYAALAHAEPSEHSAVS